jgi:ectoine hydroxylase-related dioxygenase (phytanoyl-CoA dioxygenase family)
MIHNNVCQFDLSDRAVEQFFNDGYVICKNRYTFDEVIRIRQCTDRLRQKAELLYSHITENHINELGCYTLSESSTFDIHFINFNDEGNVYYIDYQGARFILGNANGKMAIHRIVWAGGVEPFLLEFSRKDKLLYPVSQLIRSNTADHLINQIHFKMQGDGVEFHWHQDVMNRRSHGKNWTDVNGTGSFVQTFIVLDDMTVENGTLNLVKGLPPQGDLFLETLKDSDQLSKVARLDEAFPLELNVGDVLFMHPYMVHGSQPNNSSQIRRLLINGFSCPGANRGDYPGAGSAEEIDLK